MIKYFKYMALLLVASCSHGDTSRDEAERKHITNKTVYSLGQPLVNTGGEVERMINVLKAQGADGLSDEQLENKAIEYVALKNLSVKERMKKIKEIDLKYNQKSEEKKDK